MPKTLNVGMIELKLAGRAPKGFFLERALNIP